eukprot:598213-Prymnesium_polylepis.1
MQYLQSLDRTTRGASERSGRTGTHEDATIRKQNNTRCAAELRARTRAAKRLSVVGEVHIVTPHLAAMAAAAPPGLLLLG